MQAGELKTQIRIQKQVKVGTGSFANSDWVDVDNSDVDDEPVYIWAKWVNVHGSEAWVANSVQAQMGATVTIRYKSNVTLTCRILLDDTAYDIVSLDNIKQSGQWLEMKVKACLNG